jgi:hypothetical protein
VIVEFWSAHLMNTVNLENLLSVEKFDNGNWMLYKTDSDVDTKIIWKRHWRNIINPDSRVKIIWKTDLNGTFRIKHFGLAKESAISPNLTPFNGVTNEFIVN